jgi:hypothetical protein
VAKYLSTVLVVDEQWEVEMANDLIRAAKTPGMKTGRATETASAGELPKLVGSGLDIAGMVRAFAKHRMHLAPVKPEPKPKTRFAIEIREMAYRSDVVILDWNVYSDGGRRCIHLAKKLLSGDGAGKLRVLVIYTAQPPRDVEKRLESALRLPRFVDGSTSRNHLHVMVLTKADGIAILDEDPRATVVSDVPERVVAFVAESLYGILPVAALNALAAIRDNSQRLLATFDTALDPGFLGHRALLKYPEEAADQLPAIIADELRAMLEAPEISHPGRLGTVRTWIENPPEGFGPIEDPSTLKTVHELGNPYDWPEAHWPNGRPTPKKAFTSAPSLGRLHAPSLVANETEERWSYLMSVTTDYGYGPPILRLGALLAEMKQGESAFWLCLMPMCDSVRVDQTRSFPLLKLVGPVTEGAPFNCIVRYDGSWVRLKVPARVDQLEMVPFEPDNGVVIAVDAVFASSDRRQFRWVATLKPDVAHRFAQAVGGRMARIGLDESDWLRRWAKS